MVIIYQDAISLEVGIRTPTPKAPMEKPVALRSAEEHAHRVFHDVGGLFRAGSRVTLHSELCKSEIKTTHG
jgi:hypothetical protein